MAAITLSIELTDQQRIILGKFGPAGTAAEKKAWAESFAKQALRQEIIRRRRLAVQEREVARREAEEAAARAALVAEESSVETDWPDA